LEHRVILIDKGKERVSELEEGRTPIHKPGLKELIRGISRQRLHFSTALEDNL
jgi:UDP-glucose 6-dehydrogenase